MTIAVGFNPSTGAIHYNDEIGGVCEAGICIFCPTLTTPTQIGVTISGLADTGDPCFCDGNLFIKPLVSIADAFNGAHALTQSEEVDCTWTKDIGLTGDIIFFDGASPQNCIDNLDSFCDDPFFGTTISINSSFISVTKVSNTVARINITLLVGSSPGDTLAMGISWTISTTGTEKCFELTGSWSLLQYVGNHFLDESGFDASITS